MIIWLTGQPGSGKSTVAKRLEEALIACGHRVALIDGEDLRRETGNQDYSDAGRIKNVRAGQMRAAELAAEGAVVLASFVSPHRRLREEFKQGRPVVEAYLHTEKTTPKNAFHARNYEPPLSNYIDLDTSFLTVDQCAEAILDAALGRKT